MSHISHCPSCQAEIPSAEGAERVECVCGLGYLLRGSVLDRIGETQREERAAEVEDFYSISPFPGYAPGDDGPTLIDRCRRSAFLCSLDAALPADAKILDCGCGTAQISAFLALSAPGRQVFGIDGCRASLAHADEFRSRAGIENLQLVRGDLFDLPVTPERYQFVLSRGVVHHTPDPDEATRRVASCVAPGGYLLLGFYETAARSFHVARRALGKVLGRPVRALDPVLQRSDLDEDKKRIWIDDQYKHPLEHILPLDRVNRVLEAEGFRYLRTVPPSPLGANVFDPTPELSASARARLRLGWAIDGIRDPDAGLVFVVAQKN